MIGLLAAQRAARASRQHPSISPGEGASLQEVMVGVEAASRMIVRISSVAKRAAEIQRALEIEMKQEVFDRVVRTISGAFDYANRFETPEERREAFANRLRILAVNVNGEGDQAEQNHPYLESKPSPCN